MKSPFRLPGPTPLPPQVFAAMQRPMIPHRGVEFSVFYRALLERCRRIHLTDSAVLIWPASGSAAWEIGLVNLLSPGDPLLSVAMGDFGDRFRTVAIQLGFDVRTVDAPWGTAITPTELGNALERNPEVKAVLVTHNETSTGVTNPLADLAAVVREHGALLIVDAVSAAGGIRLKTDEWGLDFVLSGSQKAWMCPPGLAIVAVSERALAIAGGAGCPRYFFDLPAMARAASQGQTPTTPPLSLLYALDAATEMIESEGLEAVWERHESLGRRTRSGLRQLGLQILPVEEVASNTVTAFFPPPGVPVSGLVHHMSDQFGITLAGGQGRMSEEIVRIGHMGWVDEEDIDFCLKGLASSLSHFGHTTGTAAKGI